MYIGDFYQNHDHAPIRQIVFYYLRLKYKYQWPFLKSSTPISKKKILFTKSEQKILKGYAWLL